jgi:hypothetical protein
VLETNLSPHQVMSANGAEIINNIWVWSDVRGITHPGRGKMELRGERSSAPSAEPGEEDSDRVSAGDRGLHEAFAFGGGLQVVLLLPDGVCLELPGARSLAHATPVHASNVRVRR